MIFEGTALRCHKSDKNIVEMILDVPGQSMNTLNQKVLGELEQALDNLEKDKDIKGLILSSAKNGNFVAGADITEFLGFFIMDDSELLNLIKRVQNLFSRIEDAPYPTVVLIDGHALGGGMELALSFDYRLASSKAKLGLPETKLGIIPGWGGTVRLPRVVGADNAIEWISSGRQYKAADAFKVGAIDGVVESQEQKNAAYALIKEFWGWQARLQTS